MTKELILTLLIMIISTENSNVLGDVRNVSLEVFIISEVLDILELKLPRLAT